jgi:hypothetical protein
MVFLWNKPLFLYRDSRAMKIRTLCGLCSLCSLSLSRLNFSRSFLTDRSCLFSCFWHRSAAAHAVCWTRVHFGSGMPLLLVGNADSRLRMCVKCSLVVLHSRLHQAVPVQPGHDIFGRYPGSLLNMGQKGHFTSIMFTDINRASLLNMGPEWHGKTAVARPMFANVLCVPAVGTAKLLDFC